jgi:hypothetical protein
MRFAHPAASACAAAGLARILEAIRARVHNDRTRQLDLSPSQWQRSLAIGKLFREATKAIFGEGCS